MRTKILALAALVGCFLFSRPAAAQFEWLIEKTSGCCSWHGGVAGCVGGRDQCRDGSLSPSCTCYSPPNPTPYPTLNPTPYPTAIPTAKPTSWPTLAPTARPTAKPTATPVSISRSKPKKRVTPGAVLSVTLQELCTPGYSDGVRHVTSAMKRKVFQRYGIVNPKKGQYEIDHLISLELGGSNAITNLWPQPYNATWGAHQKDQLENELHDLVCSGQMDLATAQQTIANDWIAAYKSVFHTDKPI